MKRKIMDAISYMLGLVYLMYCLFNVEAWVLSHTEKHLLFVALAWIVAIIFAVVFVVLRLTKKQSLKMYLPAFFFAIGFIIYVVATDIPCCPGG